MTRCRRGGDAAIYGGKVTGESWEGGAPGLLLGEKVGGGERELLWMLRGLRNVEGF